MKTIITTEWLIANGAAGGVSFLREENGGKRALVRLNDMSYSGEYYRIF